LGRGDHCFPLPERLLRPKKTGPDQRVPVMWRAISERDGCSWPR
jgi:hypothetical protein